MEGQQGRLDVEREEKDKRQHAYRRKEEREVQRGQGACRLTATSFWGWGWLAGRLFDEVFPLPASPPFPEAPPLLSTSEANAASMASVTSVSIRRRICCSSAVAPLSLSGQRGGALWQAEPWQ